MRRSRKKRIEMSKKLLIVSDLLAVSTAVLTFIAVFKTMDVSPLAYLIPGVFGLASVAHGFYFWKAKAENLKKFGQADKIASMTDSDGITWNFAETGTQEGEQFNG